MWVWIIWITAQSIGVGAEKTTPPHNEHWAQMEKYRGDDSKKPRSKLRGILGENLNLREKSKQASRN